MKNSSVLKTTLVTCSALVGIAAFVPSEVKAFAWNRFTRIFKYYSPYRRICIENNGTDLFPDVKLYLSRKIPVSSTYNDLKLSICQDVMTFEFPIDTTVSDNFEGVMFYWILRSHMALRSNNTTSEVRSYELIFPKLSVDVFHSYVSFVRQEAKCIRESVKPIQIFSLDVDLEDWDSLTFSHPSTFSTLSLDTRLKESIINELDVFVGDKDVYKRRGRPWQRGYLLYGPPGTGKTSLIAAMANYLRFDIYDLDLAQVRTNVQLKALVTNIPCRSIIVVEDIDCSIKFKYRNDDEDVGADSSQVTLSGFLNVLDGLHSSFGEQRIVVFTTNYREKLDSALLRPGRMDVQIHMSYCTPSAFEILASNYLDTSGHELFTQIKELLLEVKATPAEIAEQLTGIGSVHKILKGLVEYLTSINVKKEDS